MKKYLNYNIDLDNEAQWQDAEATFAAFRKYAPHAIVDPGNIVCHKCGRIMEHHHRHYWEDPNPRWKISCPTDITDMGGFVHHR